LQEAEPLAECNLARWRPLQGGDGRNCSLDWTGIVRQL